MKLTITIQLGNAAMQSAQDLHLALHQISLTLEQHCGFEPITYPLSGLIRDTNGIIVGKWALSQ